MADTATKTKDQKTTVTPGNPPRPAAPPQAVTKPAAPPTATAVAKASPVVTPDFFLAPAADAAPTGPHIAGYGWVGFVTSSTKNEARKDGFKASGGQLPGFLFTEGGVMAARQPFDFHLIDAQLISTRVDGKGRVIDGIPKAVTKDDAEWTNPDTGKAYYRPHYYALVAVVMGQALRPAVIDCRNGLRRAIDNAAKLLTKVRTQDGLAGFAASGPKFSDAAKAFGKYPSAVFVATASGKQEEIDGGDGESYNTGVCSIRPSSIDEGERFLKSIGNDNWRADFALALRSYKDKVVNVLAGQTDDGDVAE